MSSESESEAKKKKVYEETKKPDMPLPMMPGKKEKMEQKAVEKRVGLIESIMNENRNAQKKRQEADAMPQSITSMFDALKDQSSEQDSDVAPMSSLVDTPTKEELLKRELKKAQKSVQLASASSASEDESANEKKRKFLQSQQQTEKKRVTFKDSQEETKTELIDTSSNPIKSALKKKSNKPLTYKGVKIQSDNEEDANKNSSSDGQSSKDSAEEYFQQQRKLMRERLTGTKALVQNFGTDSTLFKNEEDFKSLPDPSKTASRFDDDEVAGDMNEFDRMMRESMAEADKVAEDEQQKAREEQERLRIERLRQQEENLRREQEKKQRERDELMDKLKK